MNAVKEIEVAENRLSRNEITIGEYNRIIEQFYCVVPKAKIQEAINKIEETHDGSTYNITISECLDIIKECCK